MSNKTTLTVPSVCTEFNHLAKKELFSFWGLFVLHQLEICQGFASAKKKKN